MTKPILKRYDIAPDVTAFSTTRHGGYGTGEYAEMNINRYCGDCEGTVAKNTEALAQELGIGSEQIIMPHQTHGTEIIQIAKEFIDLKEPVQKMILEGVDALMTDQKGVCIGVSTADCIPVLLYDPEHNAAAAVHAGWRGTAKMIAAKVVKAMQMAYASQAEDLIAVIGPGISVEAFEVGDEVYEEFAASGFNMEKISVRKDKWHINLPLCNKLQLEGMGLKPGNISDVGICTYNNAADYFSARRLGTQSGRIFTGIMLHN